MVIEGYNINVICVYFGGIKINIVCSGCFGDGGKVGMLDLVKVAKMFDKVVCIMFDEVVQIIISGVLKNKL